MKKSYFQCLIRSKSVSFSRLQIRADHLFFLDDQCELVEIGMVKDWWEEMCRIMCRKRERWAYLDANLVARPGADLFSHSIWDLYESVISRKEKTILGENVPVMSLQGRGKMGVYERNRIYMDPIEFSWAEFE